jgi:hypothetical protein
MTTEQQLAYWRAHARKHEDRVKAQSDYDDLKAKAAQYDELARESMTEQEKAVEAARAEARAAAQTEFGGRLVDAQIIATSAGRLSQEQLQVLLDGLDRGRFLTDAGEVDTERVRTYVDGIAPAAAPGAPAGPKWPDLGQGKRNSSVKPSVQAGADRYREKHPTKST